MDNDDLHGVNPSSADLPLQGGRNQSAASSVALQPLLPAPILVTPLTLMSMMVQRTGTHGILFRMRKDEEATWTERLYPSTEHQSETIDGRLKKGSDTKRKHRIRRSGVRNMMADAEIGRSIPSHAERVVYCITNGQRRLAESTDWVNCNLRSPSIMLSVSAWPTRRCVRALRPALYQQSAMAYDVNGGSIAMTWYIVHGLTIYNEFSRVHIPFRSYGRRTVAIMDLISNPVLTCVASVYSSRDISITIGNLERRKWFTRIVSIHGLADVGTFGDITCLRWGRLARSRLHCLREQQSGSTGEGSSSSEIQYESDDESPVLLAGFQNGSVMIRLCKIINLQNMKHISESIFMDVMCPEAGTAAVSDLHLEGSMLYVARTGNIEKNLVAYDLNSGNPAPTITFFGHVNKESLLRIDIAGGVLAAGGDDRRIRFWDADRGGSPIISMSFEDVIDDVRIGTTDRDDDEWVGGLWAKSTNKSYICGLIANRS